MSLTCGDSAVLVGDGWRAVEVEQGLHHAQERSEISALFCQPVRMTTIL
ncbi:hypothetical protein GT755_37575 [Herbidospora sp. NEAU-GS84]|uniref:Uncharacterized protein n=1 Tax=Herbidospora solisilvae TaxID=2696284 RepID=A0A7C9J8D4_9ACTN|nr:hypothetical protein [Herbidospora solisilvae]NAS27367.1 hypothetical protein [Herbidospora solisilvae]